MDKDKPTYEELERENRFMVLIGAIVVVFMLISVSFNYYLTIKQSITTDNIILKIDERTNTLIYECGDLYDDNFTLYKDCIELFVPLPDDFIKLVENGKDID